MQKKMLLFLAVFFTGIIAMQAQPIQYGAILLGSKESPPNASAGLGGARITIDAVAKTMRVECSFQGLTGNVTAAHIHAATAVALTGTAGVATQTPTFFGFPSGVTSGSYDNTFDMTLASSYNAAFVTANGGTTATAFNALQAAMAAGKSYINIHSSAFAGGEIRGFLVPCATTSTTDLAICPSQLPYTWNGLVFNGAGSQSKLFPRGNVVGCDSLATLNLSVKANTTSDTTATVCNKFTWHDSTYKVSTDAVWHTTNAAGCDSARTLHLTITSVTSTTSKTDATCYGTSTGSITVNPTFGVGPFTYRIGTVASYVSTNNFTNLRAGKYTVSILDANGCAGITTQVTIAQPAAVTGTTSATPATCFGGATGSITVNPSTGVAPFTYKLGTSGTFGSSNVFSNVKGGKYIVYLQDANSCIGNTSVTVLQPTKISATFTQTPETCPNAKNGSVTVNGAGGTAPYTYRFGGTGAFGSSNTFSNLKAGSYRIYVNDANGCSGYSILTTVSQTSPICNASTFARGAVSSTVSEGIMVSPNPTNNQFKLMLPSTGNAATVRVLDVNGKTIYTTKTGSQSITFGENFAPGVYMVEVRQGETVKTLKAVKGR